jgi:hypothetical protein
MMGDILQSSDKALEFSIEAHAWRPSNGWKSATGSRC